MEYPRHIVRHYQRWLSGWQVEYGAGHVAVFDHENPLPNRHLTFHVSVSPSDLQGVRMSYWKSMELGWKEVGIHWGLLIYTRTVGFRPPLCPLAGDMVPSENRVCGSVGIRELNSFNCKQCRCCHIMKLRGWPVIRRLAWWAYIDR